MSQVNGYGSYNPYNSGYGAGDTAGNPGLDAESQRSKEIQTQGLKLSNDATQDSNVKGAAEKRR
ncbi:hypothetical protein [Pseudomonas sp. GXZC]|uniref:hypothetical protein n=1 Tax=unclassified Pseudomonas TaxID=196821 RepID=UPI001055877C|nr:hypothetical protein [Pseudomonas sp. GXZC]WAT29579.1 hypothetical protein OZ428_04365 [Pseudomonas sp. GXZC]